jgi:hypothetical protein
VACLGYDLTHGVHPHHRARRAGLLMYLLCVNAKAQDIGKLLFFAAVLALLIALAPSTVKLLSK